MMLISVLELSFLYMYMRIIFSSVLQLADWEKRYPRDQPYILILIYLFVILIIYHFWFRWQKFHGAPIVLVPGHC